MIVNVNRTFTELRSLKGKIPKGLISPLKDRFCQEMSKVPILASIASNEN